MGPTLRIFRSGPRGFETRSGTSWAKCYIFIFFILGLTHRDSTQAFNYVILNTGAHRGPRRAADFRSRDHNHSFLYKPHRPYPSMQTGNRAYWRCDRNWFQRRRDTARALLRSDAPCIQYKPHRPCPDIRAGNRAYWKCDRNKFHRRRNPTR